MKIGCFALVEPFCGMERQFQAIREMGVEYADLTDNHDGATLGVEYGFAASVSLESHPARIRAMAAGQASASPPSAPMRTCSIHLRRMSTAPRRSSRP